MTLLVGAFDSNKGVDFINDILVETGVAVDMLAVFGHFLKLLFRLLQLTNVAFFSLVFIVQFSAEPELTEFFPCLCEISRLEFFIFEFCF